jgi:PAS domain S-box-containing protein
MTPLLDPQLLQALRIENEALRLRLAESEETLRAIRNGEVDALVVGDKLYVLEGIEAESNRFRGEVLSQIDDAVVAVDNEMRIVYFNAAAERQYGINASEALGRPLPEICHLRWPAPDDGALAEQALRTEGVWRGANVHVLRDGREIEVESTVSVMRDAAGAATGLLAVLRDVTEKVRTEQAHAARQLAAEQALRDADRRKDEFIATLAHELRNPLAPISNALHLMQRSGNPEVLLNSREVIGRQLAQLIHLVDDLLDVSRISQGKLELRMEAVDVVAVVSAAVETCRPLIDAAAHQLDLQLPAAGALMLRGDPTRLCQIVANLLNNAAKYTPRGGRIEVTARRDGDHVVIDVRDSGIGIAPAKLPWVFDLFAQVDRSMERAQGGLGIGLALVKQLTEMHGGTVQALSEGPGQGCTFQVRLPLAAGEAGLAPAFAQPAAAGGSVALRVVVADDNVDIADSLVEVLRVLGHDAHAAHDGPQALALVEGLRPDVVLLDVGMPKLNGLEVARRIRSQPWGRTLLLVAISGWGQEHDREQTRQAGFDRHFVKPVELDVIQDLMDSWAAVQRAPPG